MCDQRELVPNQYTKLKMTKKNYKSTKNTVLCGHCGNKTLMRVISEGKYHKQTDIFHDWSESTIRVLLCPSCEEFNIIQDYKEGTQFTELNDAVAKTNFFYPLPQEFADSSPEAEGIRDTYREAVICFKADLLSSSVAMCRKTIELLCTYFVPTESCTLMGKLQKMKNKQIIDTKLYDWATVLRISGNQAVHTDTKFLKEDVQDILDVTYALVEYCIDLDYKFKNFMQRQGNQDNILAPSSPREEITNEQIETLMQALKDNEIFVRYYAAITLAQRDINIETVLPVLLELLESKYIPLKQSAQNCLKKLRVEAVTKLINVLETHHQKDVRVAAATILGDMGVANKDIVRALFKALRNKKTDDSKDEVQQKAALALEKLGYEAISTFVDMYSENSNSNELR